MDEYTPSRYAALNRQQDDAPEADLVLALQRKEPGALETVYRLYAGRLLAYLTARLGDRSLAEDVLQEVMLAAWKGARKFRGECRLYTWLLVIARNRAINAFNRQVAAHQDLVTLDEVETKVDHATTPVYADEYASLAEALNLLSTDQREALELVFFHGLSLEETALVQAVPSGTVKSRLHRAKSRLRDLLKEDGGE